MAGGIWTSQNKILPGVYINVKSQPNANASVGSRGTVAIAKALSWGAPGEIVEIIPGTDVTPAIGYDLSADQALFLREMMRGTDVTAGPTKILLYRYTGTGGVKATATVGSNLTATAKYVGVRGNDISVIVTADPDGGSDFDVSTVVDGRVVDTQTGATVADLVSNDWVDFSGTGALEANAGTALTGGVDPTVAAADDAAFLTAVEPYAFDVLAYDGSTQTVINAYVAFIKRMNEQLGHKCQLVVGDTAANSEYVISPGNGYVLPDGTALTAQQAVWWVAGSEAGAMYYQSLTYAQHPTAIAASPKLTDAQAEALITAGKIAIIDNFGLVRICTDIDTLTTVTPTKGAEFKKNRVMRVVMQLCNDIYEHFSGYYIGKVDNNDSGRSLLRAWIIGYCNEMLANSGIQNFSADDVEVLPGSSIDAVVINIAIQPVDAIEKVYVTVTVDANISVAAAE